MASHTEVAQAILDDLRGGGFYRDADVLADFLQGQFGPAATREAATDAAKAILTDLDGAGYYRDSSVLADFLRARFRSEP